MQHLYLRFFVRLLLCVVFAFVAWRQADAIGLIFSSLVFGIALASPLLDLLLHTKLLLKQGVLSVVHGRRYVFQMTDIDIVQDAHQQCWLSIMDVRRVIKRFPKDTVVIKLYPHDVMYDKKLRGSRIRATALVDYLQQSKNLTALKFMQWIEREVIFPAAKKDA